MSTYTEDKCLRKMVLRMDKNYSSFFYFTLEANENICFYSTLPFEKGQAYRDIVVYITIELEENFNKILEHCRKKQDIELLESEIIVDK